MISHPNVRFPPWKARQKVLQLDVHIPWFLGFGCNKHAGDVVFSPQKFVGTKKYCWGVNFLLLLKEKRDLRKKI